jgi:glycosyltransferase involved in cell wall biosynthesis
MPSEAITKARIAVTCGGDPTDVTAYSGSPAALLKGLGEAGVEALPLRAALGPRAHVWFERALVASALRPRDLMRPGELRERRRQLRMTRGMTPAVAKAQAWAARRGLARLGQIQGIVQYGTGVRLPAGTAFVTVEDATIKQVVEGFAWPWIGNPSPETLARWHANTSRCYARATACAFMSHWAARSAIEDYGVSPEKAHVVGVGRNYNPPCPERDWSSPRALFVGLDWERKNGPAVVRAFARLRERWPHARLDVVGAHPPLQTPGVHGHGRLSLADPRERAQVEALFAQATFFVMPSLHEPAGIVYAEAQAAGLASIATTAGGARTIVGDAGIFVDPHDEDAIAQAMLALAEPATAAKLGARASARAPLFTWRAVAERLLRALAPTGVDVDALAPCLSADAYEPVSNRACGPSASGPGDCSHASRK